ncbi:MAG: MFS transporter [Segniliparus sp.]|uniref:MFS transporter n=1 Tax=Segniliparus sp. TaxID=2804064 RepID=UPI003F37EAD2
MSRITKEAEAEAGETAPRRAEALAGLLEPGAQAPSPALVEEQASSRSLVQLGTGFVKDRWNEFLHGRHDHTQRSNAFCLAILALGGMQFMATLDGTVANIALFRIQEALHLSAPGRSWVITAYVLAFGGLMLLGGRLGDLIGRKRAFLIGVGVFTLGSLLCSLSWDETSLLVFRAIQGSGAALASPTGLALVATLFTPGTARNIAVAIYGGMLGIGSIAGLIFGGALTELGRFVGEHVGISGLDWQLIFVVNVPIGIGILVLTLLTIPDVAPHSTKLDVPGAVTSAGAVFLFVFGFTQGPIWGWKSPGIVGPLLVGVALLAAFVVIELRSPNPLVPLRLFANKDKIATFGTIVLSGAILMCLTIYVVLFFQDVLRYSPLKTGLSFIPFAIALGVGSQIAVLLLKRIAPRWTAGVGLAFVLAGFLYGSTLTPSAHYVQNLLAPILLIGFGIGVVLVPLPLCALVGVPDEELGPLAAIALVAQELGGPVGLSVMGGLLFSSRKLEVGKSNSVGMTPAELAQLSSGYTFGLLILAGAALVAAAVGFFIGYTPDQIAEAQEAKAAADSGEGELAHSV